MRTLAILVYMSATGVAGLIGYAAVENVKDHLEPKECFFPAQALNEEKTLFAVDGKVQCGGGVE